MAGLLPSRLTGVDAARGAALLGMTAVHVLPAVEDGSESAGYAVASGRSAALFAVLAGVGLALAFRSPGPRDAAALIVRAVLVTALGLTLALLDAGVAVVLAYYGLLFVVAVPLLRLSARALAGLALVVAVLVPLVLFEVRQDWPPAPVASPGWADLVDDPVGQLQALLVTGYYPVLAWLSYLCAGMAAGRLRLSSTGVAVSLLAGGTALALLAVAASSLLLGPLGGLREIEAADGGEVDVEESRFGTVPTTTRWWLAVDAPHSTTPPDLLHTVGTSLAVLGALLLLARVARPVLRPLADAGAMPLTLYSLHLVALGGVARDWWGRPDSDLRWWLLQVAALTAFAVLWRLRWRRGPLEAVVAAVTSRVRGR